jgi:hypothetical protein
LIICRTKKPLINNHLPRVSIKVPSAGVEPAQFPTGV